MADGSPADGISIADLFSSMQQAVQAINALNQTLAAVFPQAGASITHSASVGGDVLPAAPAGFITVTLSGAAYKIPIYNT